LNYSFSQVVRVNPSSHSSPLNITVLSLIMSVNDLEGYEKIVDKYVLSQKIMTET